jgi:ketosteroid isomerase-like protein
VAIARLTASPPGFSAHRRLPVSTLRYASPDQLRNRRTRKVQPARVRSDPPMTAYEPSAETQDFLATITPRLSTVETAFHNRDASPRGQLWSHEAPVTLFGAVLHKSGWPDVEAAFAFLASRFSDCQSFRYELLSAGANGDLAYLVGIEHTTASVGGAPPQAYELRVTTLFRREAGKWRIFHRHADPMPNTTAAREQLRRFGPTTAD